MKKKTLLTILAITIIAGCAGQEQRIRGNVDNIILQAPCDQGRIDKTKFITLTKTGDEFSLHMEPLNDEQIQAFKVVDKLGGGVKTYGNFLLYCNPDNNSIVLSPLKK